MKKFITNMNFVKKYSDMKLFDMIMILIPNVFSIIVSVVLPVVSAQIIIKLTSNDFLGLYYAGLAMLIIALLRNLVVLLSSTTFNKIYKKLFINIQSNLAKEMLKIENKELDEKGTGLFTERLISDTSNISSGYKYLIECIKDFIQCIGIYIAIFLISKIVFLYLACTTIIIYLVTKRRTNIVNKNDKIFRKEREKDVSFASELVRGSRDIKMLGSEELFVNKLYDEVNKTNDIKYKNVLIKKGYGCIIGTIKSVSELGLIVLIVFLIDRGILQLSSALILYNYSNKTGFIDRIIIELFEQVKSFDLSIDRILEVLDNNKFSKEKFGNKKLTKAKGNIEFNNVCFSYKDKQVLNNISFRIKENQTVAFVGKTGSGKSTIFNLICKLYNINSGKILLDDYNINELDKNSVRGNITIINQNPYIFNLSIKDNLKLVKKNVTDDEIKEACKLACLDDFINTLKDGYNTMIGEGGVNLSGGQRQRLAIARALVQKTEIILFDEATSALDNKTEHEITEAINNLKGEYTVIIIAHRLSTIKNSDNIFCLEDGKILGEGTHSELLKMCLPYKELYKKNNEVVK